MKPVLIVLLGVLLVCSTSCGSGSTPTEKTTEEATSAPAPEATPKALPMNGDNYEITVLDSEQASPRKEMTGTIGNTQVVINYGSPSVKGRVIWGGLEPYGKVWRAGANEATTMQFSTDVKVEGQPLAAGTYTFFTIPEEGDWAIIFNSVLEQWGAYSHDPEKDVLRATISPNMEEGKQEMLDYYIEGNQVVLRWEKVALPIQITATAQ